MQNHRGCFGFRKNSSTFAAVYTPETGGVQGFSAVLSGTAGRPRSPAAQCLAGGSPTYTRYMKLKHTTLLPLLLVALATLAGACSSDSDYSSTYSTSDCTVTSAVMGTLKRHLTTKSSTGADSVYTVSVVGSLYPLSIDQTNARIYNVDSLPVGTDPSRVVFSTFSTTGVATIRSLYSQTDTTFTATDSTDCSVERLITVYAYNGTSTRTYSLNINVHKEEGDTFRWARLLADDATLKGLEGTPRFVRTATGNALTYGLRDGKPVAVSATTPGDWTTTALSEGFDPASVCANRTCTLLYAIDGGRVVTSTDGINWTATPDAGFTADALVAAGTKTVIALKGGAFWSSADGGATWTEDKADEPGNIPVTNCRGTVVPSRTDSQLEDAVVVGRKADGGIAVWRRTLDLSGTDTFGWYCLPEMTGDYLTCPNLEQPSLFTYDGTTVLTGLKADGTPASLYVSQDNGRTWKDNIVKQLTLAAAGTHRTAATADADNFIWIVDTATGSIWRGRHNRLGWKTEQDRFERSLHR